MDKIDNIRIIITCLIIRPFRSPPRRLLPLLCDSDIAGVSHPYVPLPPRFRYPQDTHARSSSGATNSARRGSALHRSGCGLQRVRFRTRCWPSAPRRASPGPLPTTESSAGRSSAQWASKTHIGPTAGGATVANAGRCSGHQSHSQDCASGCSA